jgi:hypothetical protein
MAGPRMIAGGAYARRACERASVLARALARARPRHIFKARWENKTTIRAAARAAAETGAARDC